MCGRYSLTTERHDLARELGIPLDAIPEDYSPRWNVAPTQTVAALRRDSAIRFDWLQWGLVPSFAKDPTVGSRMINARSETLAERPSFRDSFRDRRCLVVADGFYEWAPPESGRGPKTAWYIRLATGEPFTFAGLWSRWRPPGGEELLSCTIVTGEPNDLVASVHDRMPIIVPRENRMAWLDRDHRDPDSLANLLRPLPSERMRMHTVSRHVNSPHHDDPECVEPAEPEAPAVPEPPPSLFD